MGWIGGGMRFFLGNGCAGVTGGGDSKFGGGFGMCFWCVLVLVSGWCRDP